MTGPPRYRLALADDHALVVDGLAAIAREWADVVGTATEVDAVAGLVRAQRPDVLVLDLFFGSRPTFALIEALVAEFPRLRIVVLTAHEDPVFAQQALQSGAAGYVLKRGNVGELRVAIGETMSSRCYLSPEVRAHPAGDLKVPRKDVAGPFTARQLDVLALLRKNLSSKEIGTALNISAKTVDRHIDDMCKAIQVHRRAKLLAWADTAMPRPPEDEP